MPQYSYRNGGTDKLENALKGTAFQELHTDSETSPRLFDNRLIKGTDEETGLKIITLAPTRVRFFERAADDDALDVSAISTELQAKANALNAKYRILDSIAWRTHRLDTERRATVGEYLAQDDAAQLFPLPRGVQEEEGELQQWASIHFIGDVYTGESDTQAKRTDTDAGSELDLMNVHKSDSKLRCLGVGNVKVGDTKLSGDAVRQNADAITLLQSFAQDKRLQLKNGDWAHVKRITAIHIERGEQVLAQRPLVVDDAVEQVTIGAKSAPGTYSKRLDYKASEIMAMARYLKHLDAKRKGK